MSDPAANHFLFSEYSHSIAFRADYNAGIIFWALANTVVGTYVAFTLLILSKERVACVWHKTVLIVLAALSLSLGCCACQLLTSRIRILPTEENEAYSLIGFNIGFIALSLCIPIILVIAAFFLLDPRSSCRDADRFLVWKCCGCGLLVGLSVGFMHYCPFFSLPSFDTTFAPGRIFLVLLLNISGSLFSFFASTFYVSKLKTKCLTAVLYLLISLVLGACIIGGGFLAHSGMEFNRKDERTDEQSEINRNRGDVLTLAIPAVISVSLACASVHLIFASRSKRSNTCPSAQRLTLTSIAFSHDGRVLVNQKGMLPTQNVDLEGLPENILDELESGRSTFQWLFAISFSWSIISPYLRRINLIAASTDKRPSRWHAFLLSLSLSNPLSFFRFKSRSDAMPAQARLKLRLVAAATQLASQLDLPLEKLGTLHYHGLETGSRIDIAEFLHLSEHAARQNRDVEHMLKVDETSKGLMLFFVRSLPQNDSSEDLHYPVKEPRSENKAGRTSDSGQRQRYIPAGFKMRFIGRFRGVLAESTGARLADVDKVLNECKITTTQYSRSVLEAGCTYVSLFAEKVSCDGSSEVLVYDFAKHQLPSYKLELHALTHEMRTWLRGMSGFTALDIIQICKHEVEQGRRHRSFSPRSSHADASDYEEEHRRVMLLHFKQALSAALSQLIRDMSFVGESLETWTYLTPHILDVPSVGSSPEEVPVLAHMIVLHAEQPDPLDADPFEDESDFVHLSACSMTDDGRPAMPSVFEYIPRTLFDVIHALAISPPARETFRSETTRELVRLTGVGASVSSQRATTSSCSTRPGPGRLSRALVSSFSIDSINDEETGNRSAVTRVRKSWAALKIRARSLKLSSRKACRQDRSNQIPLTHSTSRSQLLSHSHKVSSSTASTSTTSRFSIPEPPVPYLYSESTVQLNSPFRSATAGYGNDGGFVGRSRTKSTSKSAARRSGWEETTPVSVQIPLPVPPTLFRMPNSLSSAISSNRAASKSVPNVSATRSGFL